MTPCEIHVRILELMIDKLDDALGPASDDIIEIAREEAEAQVKEEERKERAKR